MTPARRRWLEERRAWCNYKRPPVTAHWMFRRYGGWTLVWKVGAENDTDAIRCLTECF